MLDVAENRIKEFPACLANLKNLAYLWMDSNSVKEIPPIIMELDSLSYVNLDYNLIKDLPVEVPTPPCTHSKAAEHFLQES